MQVHLLKLGFHLLVFFSFLPSHLARSQSLFGGKEQLFTKPRYYMVYRTNETIVMDGYKNERAWQQAPWSSDFVDIEGDLKPKPAHRTHFKMLWNQQHLYLYAELEEPHLWGTLTRHDDIIYNDNDFEIFIDPDGDTHQYFEIEVNILKTIFDLYMDKPYRNGGKPHIQWDAAQVQTGVAMYGTLNKPDDQDSKWTLEMAIPFSSLAMGDVNTSVPMPATVWRMNFSRVQWNREVVNNRYERKKDANQKLIPENNWVWSEQGVINMHFPERWGYVVFTDETDSTDAKEFILPLSATVREYLWLVYYKQKDFYTTHKRYAENLLLLGFSSDIINTGDHAFHVSMHASEKTFSAEVVEEKSGENWRINQDGLVVKQ